MKPLDFETAKITGERIAKILFREPELARELHDVLHAHFAAEEASDPRERFMSCPQFATKRNLSARTVREYCELGMPHSGDGKGRRVHVQEAIAWIENGGPRRARMARKETAA